MEKTDKTFDKSDKYYPDKSNIDVRCSPLEKELIHDVAKHSGFEFSQACIFLHAFSRSSEDIIKQAGDKETRLAYWGKLYQQAFIEYIDTIMADLPELTASLAPQHDQLNNKTKKDLNDKIEKAVGLLQEKGIRTPSELNRLKKIPLANYSGPMVRTCKVLHFGK